MNRQKIEFLRKFEIQIEFLAQNRKQKIDPPVEQNRVFCSELNQIIYVSARIERNRFPGQSREKKLHLLTQS